MFKFNHGKLQGTVWRMLEEESQAEDIAQGGRASFERFSEWIVVTWRIIVLDMNIVHCTS